MVRDFRTVRFMAAPDDGTGTGDAGAGDSTKDNDGETKDDAGGTDGADLGDGGKRALDRERKARKEAQRELKEARAELDRARSEGQTEHERALDAAKREASADATKRANARILRAEVRAAAAGKLADPADAIRFVDLDEFEVDGDGEVDVKAIEAAIAALVEEKPYLAPATGSSDGQQTRKKGNGDGGSRGKDDRKISRADLKTMSSEEIVRAKTEGRLDHLLGVTR